MDALEKAMEEATPARRRWATKWMVRFFVHGRTMTRRQVCKMAQCPSLPGNGRQKHITCCAALEEPSAVVYQHHKASRMDERPKDKSRDSTDTFGHTESVGPKCTVSRLFPNKDRPSQDWTGVTVRWMALTKMANTPGNHLKALQVKEIKPPLDCNADPKTLGCLTWAMWEHRNKALHGGHQAQQQILHLVVDNQIQILHSGGPQNLPRDVIHFITQPLDIILEYSLQSKQQWVASVQVVQECRRQHEYRAYLLEQQSLWNWLETGMMLDPR